MWVSTFHSACVRILRAEHARLGFTSTFSIYDAADSQRLMTHGVPRPRPRPEAVPAAVVPRPGLQPQERAGRPRDVRPHGQDHHEQALAEAYARYQARLREANAIDFDDLIMTTVNLLQAFPDVAEHYRRRFRHVLVDEYQDTNHAQYVLVRELVGPAPTAAQRGELAVVGDADQSIYAFRGASIRNIIEFEEDYPDATMILLEQNYRSTQTILSAANAVIARNPSRKPKNLWTDSGARPADRRLRRRQRARRGGVRRRARSTRLADMGEARPGDVAVFYRTNAQSRVFEEVFIRVGLPYKVVGGVRFYERREVRDALAYLRVLGQPRRRGVAAAHPQRPARGIGDRAEARDRAAGRAGADPVRAGARPAGRGAGHRHPLGGRASRASTG